MLLAGNASATAGMGGCGCGPMTTSPNTAVDGAVAGTLGAPTRDAAADASNVRRDVEGDVATCAVPGDVLPDVRIARGIPAEPPRGPTRAVSGRAEGTGPATGEAGAGVRAPGLMGERVSGESRQPATIRQIQPGSVIATNFMFVPSASRHGRRGARNGSTGGAVRDATRSGRLCGSGMRVTLAHPWRSWMRELAVVRIHDPRILGRPL